MRSQKRTADSLWGIYPEDWLDRMLQKVQGVLFNCCSPRCGVSLREAAALKQEKLSWHVRLYAELRVCLSAVWIDAIVFFSHGSQDASKVIATRLTMGFTEEVRPGDELVISADPNHPANLIPRLCKQFYTLGNPSTPPLVRFSHSDTQVG